MELESELHVDSFVFEGIVELVGNRLERQATVAKNTLHILFDFCLGDSHSGDDADMIGEAEGKLVAAFLSDSFELDNGVL